MALLIYTEPNVPKYKNGEWIWNEECFKFEFISNKTDLTPECLIPSPKLTYGLHFKDWMDQDEEIIFRRKLVRPNYSRDSDVITIQDIKDVVLFSADKDAIPDVTIDFLHTSQVDEFLNALIIYFEYFLKTVEYLLIQRDEYASGKRRTPEIINVERMLSDYLCQHRCMVGREYGKILLGHDPDMARFHHMHKKVMPKQKKIEDVTFYEIFFNVCTRIVWVAMNRKGFKVIDCEINRLFRSGHFNIAEKQLTNLMKISKRSQQVLYGPHDYRYNYRHQMSLAIVEVRNIKPKNFDILMLGAYKYQGTDPRIAQLEQEYVTPGAQLTLVNCEHGILGHPKIFYNTMLCLDWNAVRKEKYIPNVYDPYNLVSDAEIVIPDWEEYNIQYPPTESAFTLINEKYEADVSAEQIMKWARRDYLQEMAGIDIMDEHITRKCAKEMNAGPVKIDVQKIVSEFLKEKQRKLKAK